MTEVEEDCPICANPMTLSDLVVPLYCPTLNCDFNMCANCIEAMLKSDADDYEEASDGSKQVKYHLSCPCSRSKYQVPSSHQHPTATDSSGLIAEEKKESHHSMDHASDHGSYSSIMAVADLDLHHSKYGVLSHQPIVGYVLLLREAYDASALLRKEDSSLPTSKLSKKYQFIRETTLDDVQEAALNYEIYMKGVNKNDHIHKFDWDDFSLLPRSAPSSSPGSCLKLRHEKLLQAKAWRDPTLFMGLEELMSLQEQEFVTQLMCCDDLQSLAQAAYIMHGVLNNMGGNRASALMVRELSVFGTEAPLPPPLKLGGAKPPPPLHPKQALKISGRFPLPNHMPRCIAFPVYDPMDEQNSPLRFEVPSATNIPLTVSQVRGVAGRSGLRRGDIITHVQGEPVFSNQEYAQMVGRLFADPYKMDDQLHIVVNAHTQNARLLRERAQDMQKARIQF